MKQKTSLKEQVYTSVYNDILRGVYPVNSVLNEGMLAEKYGVSKPPVREALVQICAEGLLNNLPRFGYQVVAITPAEIEDIQQLRLLLELGALDLTLPRITPEQIALLEENIAEALEIVDDLDVAKHWHQNMAFHLLLCSFCGNRFFTKELDSVLKFCTRGAFQYFTGSWEKQQLTDASNHIGLVEALKKGDAQGARAILTEDVSSMKNEILHRA